jgi:hypothetical protein
VNGPSLVRKQHRYVERLSDVDGGNLVAKVIVPMMMPSIVLCNRLIVAVAPTSSRTNRYE